jgi:hypothetical protein
MLYLQRAKAAPRLEDLPENAQQALVNKFDAHPAELTVNDQVIAWNHIQEIEVVKAARQKTLSGWFVRNIVFAEERYHVGIYFGAEEAVLPNLPLAAAQFAAQSIAFYMQAPIRYTGVEGVVAVVEE